MALKFQTSDECVALYSQARALSADKTRWNDVGELLWTISSSDGRFQDIRDGYAQLGGLFRQAWLRDNRPFWLENNLARYDAATQLWVGRGDRWLQVLQQWRETHTLPTPEQAGFPALTGN